LIVFDNFEHVVDAAPEAICRRIAALPEGSDHLAAPGLLIVA